MAFRTIRVTILGVFEEATILAAEVLKNLTV
jgi:hypothetical protein